MESRNPMIALKIIAAVFLLALSPARANQTILLSPVDQDIWTTSVYSFAPGGGGPGGGLANDLLQVGGWGDLYYSLLQIDLAGLPNNATKVQLRLYDVSASGGSPTTMDLYKITQFWNWQTQGTGSDRLRLWWKDQPAAVLVTSGLPAPTVGSYYDIDITNLYNGWQNGSMPNYGIELRPTNNNNNFNSFGSSRNANIAFQPALIIDTNRSPNLLTVAISGSGVVTSSPAGINCPGACSASFAAGTPVTLTETPASGWNFAGWGGTCNGMGTCGVTMNAAETVSATFSPVAGQPSLIFGFDTSAIQQSGSGKITDWNAVTASMLSYSGSMYRPQFVILRATRGIVGNDNCNFTDPLFAQDAQGASATNMLKVGAYHVATIFDANGSETSPVAEADNFIAVAKNWMQPGNLRPFLDLENDDSNSCGGATRLQATSTVVSWIHSWMQEVIAKTNGVIPIIYTNSYFLRTYPTLNQLALQYGYQLWVAPASVKAGSPFDPGIPFEYSPWTIDLLQYAWESNFPAVNSGAADTDVFQGNQVAFQSTLLIPSTTQSPSQTPLLSAVLPSSRSATVGNTATAFATLLNSGSSALSGCGIAPIGTAPEFFVYQTTDRTTNAVTGSPNVPASVAGGGSQTFVIALTPTGAFGPINFPFNFACTNTSAAAQEIGLNTLLLSASATPVPDIVALAASGDPGIVDVPGANGTGVFAVATVNVGAAASITVNGNTASASLPLTISLCQTDPKSGVCLQPPSAAVTTTIAANATPTFGIFVAGGGSIPFDPANNRVFVNFVDPGGVTRGATSVAVRTQ